MADWQDIPGQEGWQDVPVPAEPSIGSQVLTGATEALRGVNKGLFRAVTAPLDISANIARGVGRIINLPMSQDAPQPSEYLRGGPEQPSGELPERIGDYIGGAAGDVGMTVLPLKYLSALQSLPAAVRGSAEMMAASPLTQTGLTAAGAAAGGETGNPYIGMATPFALAPFVHGGQRTFSAAPAMAGSEEANRRALLQYGQSIGSIPTAGGVLDSKKLQTLESHMSNFPIPGVGGKVEAVHRQQREAWQNAILAKAEKGGVSTKTAVNLDTADDLLRDAGRDVGNLLKPFDIAIHPSFGQKLADIERQHGSRLMADIKEGVMDRVRELQNSPPGAVIQGETFQNVRSDLTKLVMNSKDGSVRKAVGDIIGAMDDVAQRSIPPDVWAQYADARRRYRNSMDIREALTSQHNEQTARGNIPTGRFMAETEKNPDLRELGQYGVTLGDKGSNPSGTGKHNIVTGLLAALAGLGGHSAGVPVGEMAKGAAAAAIPYGLVTGLNSAAMRKALLARYRNPSESIVGAPLIGALGAEQALEQNR